MDNGAKKLVNAVAGTVMFSYFYGTTWDMPARLKAIRSVVWDFRKELPEVL